MSIPKLVKLPDVTGASAQGPTKVYADVKEGLMVPPVKLSARTVAWVETEVAAVLAARIAGRSDDEIKTLVKELVAARAQLPRTIGAAKSE